MTRAVVDTPRRILLVSLDQVGDLVFASALVAPLAGRYTGVPIDLWCREYTRDVAALIPGIDRIIAFNPFWVGLRRAKRGTLREFLRSVSEVRATPHDIAILAAAPWRAAAATALTRIPVRIGQARRKNGPFLTDVLPAADLHRPVLEEEARLLAPLGIAHASLTTQLDPRPLADQIAEIRRRAGAPIAALHAFASIRERCVPLAQWQLVARTLSARGFAIVWVGTGPELDEVRREVAEPRWLYADQIAGTRLRDGAALLASAALFIGHDSGPLHIANAFGVPAVGVFAPGEPRRTFPQGRGLWHLVARDTPTLISADDILRAVREVSPPAPTPRSR